MSTWKHLPIDVPTDSQTVWIRVVYLYQEPFQATYYSSSQMFISVTGSINYPAFTVARWRPL
jgi:hypothetical protein